MAGRETICLVLTHDVDSAKGMKKCLGLAKLEEQLNFRSAFTFVAEEYNIPQEVFECLKCPIRISKTITMGRCSIVSSLMVKGQPIRIRLLVSSIREVTCFIAVSITSLSTSSLVTSRSVSGA